jgi:hypothetical protein
MAHPISGIPIGQSTFSALTKLSSLQQLSGKSMHGFPGQAGELRAQLNAEPNRLGTPV